MGNKKNKRKAASPAESHRSAPSHPVIPDYQADNRCNTPDQGYVNFQHAQDYLDNDSSSELEYQEETPTAPPTQHPAQRLTQVMREIMVDEHRPLYFPQIAKSMLSYIETLQPDAIRDFLQGHKLTQQLIAEAVSKTKAMVVPPPPPPPSMEVDSPPTPTAPRPPGATPPTRGKSTPPAPQSGAPAPATPPTPPAVPAPCSKPAPIHTPLAKRAPKHTTPPPPPSQAAPKLSFAAALGSKAPRPRKAHPPTKLVAPETTKWVVIPSDKSQLQDVAKRPSPHHIVSAISHKLRAWAGKPFSGIPVADLGDSHILAATWTVGCNLLVTAVKTRDTYGLNKHTYSCIVNEALDMPAFNNKGASIKLYRPPARLQIKAVPTWDHSTNRPVELSNLHKTLDKLGIFEGVNLIRSNPDPSSILSWARDPKTFNAESRPCTVMLRFYNNNGRETGALLKKAFYLLGCRRRFDKWHPRPPAPKKGSPPQAARPQAGHT
ncbi:hypothetical protein H0H81_010761 [Sphagnurus paluster]|uniref:Uncharacterized protein n=1 Tax=Sphagnurus paluster TaxID=117069 RepID=A0A9P7KFY6_9AGAR|nr:hypothetical protein H0H81_010761 [Sphagnurus paluster]